MRRTGMTPWGDMLWTKQEEATVKALHPDYKAIKKKLRRRTMIAIKARAGVLGLRKKIHIWKASDISKLRRLYTGGVSRKDILSAFPGLAWMQIDNAAQYHRILRPRNRFKPTGHKALDIIRAYAFAHNLSMGDLDDMARTRDYFQKAKWKVHDKVSDKALGRAARALGGEILPHFPDWQDGKRLVA